MAIWSAQPLYSPEWQHLGEFSRIIVGDHSQWIGNLTGFSHPEILVVRYGNGGLAWWGSGLWVGHSGSLGIYGFELHTAFKYRGMTLLETRLYRNQTLLLLYSAKRLPKRQVVLGQPLPLLRHIHLISLLFLTFFPFIFLPHFPTLLPLLDCHRRIDNLHIRPAL